MDCQTCPGGSCKWECGSRRRTWLPVHRCLDTGPCICCGCMPYPSGSRYSAHILVDIPRKDPPGIPASKCRLRLDTGRWGRKGMGCRGLIARALQLKQQPAVRMGTAAYLAYDLTSKRISQGDDASSAFNSVWFSLTWWGCRIAAGEGISSVAFRTRARGRVVDHTALRTGTARSRTRVAALLPHASPVAGAFRTDGALWTAVGRNAHIVGQAGTGWGASNVSTLRVRPTRGRHARVHDDRGSWPRGRRYNRGAILTVRPHSLHQ